METEHVVLGYLISDKPDVSKTKTSLAASIVTHKLLYLRTCM